ncbi:MAG: PIN domain-containing protein [Thermoplasmatota archaeon]
MAGSPEPVGYVVDASALAKLFLDEPDSPAFRAWYLSEVQRGETFGAPSLLGYEIAHLISRNLKPPAGAKRADWLAQRHDEVMTGIALDEAGARRGCAMAGRLTGYDAAYLAVAAAGPACLVTYDRALVQEAKGQGLRVQSPA